MVLCMLAMGYLTFHCASIKYSGMERLPFSNVMKTILLVLCFIICLVLGAAAATVSNIYTREQEALFALKAHITHDPSNLLSKNWTSNTSVCNWVGVTCDISHRGVTVLDLSNLSLTGTIPSQLGNLSSLQKLDLSYNQFSGTIPSSIFGIFTLKFLYLSDNQLSGPLPSFSNISSVQAIDFHNNSLSGELPANICNHLPHLVFLSLSVNMFDGKIPSTLSNCRQLQVCSLMYNGFSGSIPKQIGNLTRLKELNFGFNKLKGEIQQELGNLAELEQISLKNNLLTGSIPLSILNISSLSGLDFSNNSFTGSLPDGMCRNLPRLEGLYLINNQLTGPIPQSLGQCRELTSLGLSNNQFTGSIPRDIGNLTLLRYLYLQDNALTGEAPQEIGNLRNLEGLFLHDNNLVGVVPTTIFNLSTVRRLSLINNKLSGSLPSNIDLALPNLKELYLGMNNFTGGIPSFIFNSSNLLVIELGNNSFSGAIPNTFGNLRNLKVLGLSGNYFTSSTSELNLISFLTNCENLEEIELSRNPLNAILPSSIGNLSLSVGYISLFNCNISGNIPEEIGNLSLIDLRLDANNLTGSIPVTLGQTSKLQRLTFPNNKLKGSIPTSLCSLASLFHLNLAGNKLSGAIPACLGNLTTLRFLLLESNKFTSVIPSTFWNLKDILILNLASNYLTGNLPLDIGDLKVVVELNLSRNSLSSDIPTTIGVLEMLQLLSLDHNRFQGSIPESLGDLISLESLDISNNNLSGNIPTSLEKLSSLKHLNLSFNKLEGEIPRGGAFANFSTTSFLGNDLLCGSPDLQVAPCKTKTHGKSRKLVLLLGIVLPLAFAFTIVVVLAFRFVLIPRCYLKSRETLPYDDNMSLPATRRRFSHLELLRATDGFSERNLIGVGSFGSVYKARIEDGMEVAVKVFDHLQWERAFKSFEVECEVMKNIRHRNLIKIISGCSNDDFKALVLEYMPNGSLEKCLYSNNFNLDVCQRLSIMIDVASALEYLHFGYSTPIIHCDLKPNNVLLDENMVARLSDFGIAKMLSQENQSMTQTQTLATIGYIAPEYGEGGQVSRKGDVYSYGIMLMETFTRKKPTDEIFSGEMNLRHWVNDSLPISVMEVVDRNLLSREDEDFSAKELCVSSVLNLAMECTRESPELRINTKEIVIALLKIRDVFIRTVEGRGRGRRTR